MNPTANIPSIYEELTARYDRISVSTIKSMLKGKLKVKTGKVDFAADKSSSPRLEEAEDAFKKYNCAIFTAFRGGYSLEQNLERNACLKADMEALGMSFRPVNGCYREADWEYPCVEYCYFVYNEDKTQKRQFFENTYRLSAKYDQDSFLYKRAGINRTAFLVATTDAGRNDLHGNIKFAGQLYLDVPDVEAWTDCSDGRFAFQLKGMVMIGTSNKKIKIGEGSIFDIDGYGPDGLVVIHKIEPKGHPYFKDGYLANKDKLPIIHHTFVKESQAETAIRSVVTRALNQLKKQKCKRIGIHCSAYVNGSAVDAARVAHNAITEWINRNNRKVEWILIVDTYGDYCKMS